MNNLTRLYKDIKTFADSHRMVNQFLLIGSEDDINKKEFDYRTLLMMPLEANLSRDFNSPIYTLDFEIILIDRIITDNDSSYISSTEENINVIGQLQDYLLQQQDDVEFNNIEMTTGMSEDYNITIAMCDFTVNLARGPYIRGIDI
jgi:hypothetical protein|tara:strand:- start:154 stop:591 length:438 start_codon:yes stop_codon:yes gene_type:complete